MTAVTAKAESRGRAKAAVALYRKSSASFIALALRFLSPLIILEILFVAIYLTFSTTSAKAVALASVSAAANIRASCGRNALADLVKLLYLQTDPVHIQAAYLDTFQAASCVLDNTALLAFGTAPPTLTAAYAKYTPAVENGGASVLSAADAATAYAAMFGNACLFIAAAARSSDFDVPACESFSSGVVRLGLGALSNAWAARIALLSDAKLRTFYSSASLGDGAGWIVPTAQFNYSTVRCASPLGARQGCHPLTLIKGAHDDGTLQEPSPVSDSHWEGDVNASLLPASIPAGGVPTNIAASFASDDFKWLTNNLLYMTPGFRALCVIYNNAAQTTILNYVEFLTTFSASWLSFFAVVIFFFFLPSVDMKNADVHTTRSMLLYLPVPVVQRVTSILALVDDIIAKNNDSLAVVGGGASGRSRVAPG